MQFCFYLARIRRPHLDSYLQKLKAVFQSDSDPNTHILGGWTTHEVNGGAILLTELEQCKEKKWVINYETSERFNTRPVALILFCLYITEREQEKFLSKFISPKIYH
jgi:hypothetical protein